MHDSLITKKVIAHSLKELMQLTPFQKISIRDIMGHAYIRRQTFYYHFQDKYELLAWIYNQEASENIEDYLDYEHWSKVITRLFYYLKENKTFYLNALEVTEQNSFDLYFFEHTKSLILTVVTDMQNNAQVVIPEESIQFFCTFYAHAFVGMTKEWLFSDCKTPVELLSQNIQLLLEESFSTIIERFKS